MEEKEYTFYEKSRLDFINPQFIENIGDKLSYFLFVSQSATNYDIMKLLKIHIFFNPINPKIYLLPFSITMAFALHSNCDVCSKWIKFFILDLIDNGRNKNFIIQQNYKGENKVIIMQSPTIQYFHYFLSDKNIDNDQNFIDGIDIDIIREGSGNIYTCVQLAKDAHDGNLNYENIKNLIFKNVVSIKNNDNTLLKRLSLLRTFTYSFEAYENVIPEYEYCILKKLVDKHHDRCINYGDIILLLTNKVKRIGMENKNKSEKTE